MRLRRYVANLLNLSTPVFAVLACPYCNKHRFKTARALSNHKATAHPIEYEVEKRLLVNLAFAEREVG